MSSSSSSSYIDATSIALMPVPATILRGCVNWRPAGRTAESQQVFAEMSGKMSGKIRESFSGIFSAGIPVREKLGGKAGLLPERDQKRICNKKSCQFETNLVANLVANGLRMISLQSMSA